MGDKERRSATLAGELRARLDGDYADWRAGELTVAGAGVNFLVFRADTAPFGPVAVLAPCRVTAVLDEPDCRGFSYAALPGHPLVGQESFTVERGRDGAVVLRIRSVSRPTGLPGLAPPLARAAQRLVNRRYAAAARRLAA